MMNKNIHKPFIITILITAALFFNSVSLSAQEQINLDNENLSKGFMDINIGLSIDQVKQLLLENSFFDYRGDPDVSMLMTSGENLIEVRGYSFIDKGYFQFYENRLFIITLVLNREKIDFYTMHMNFQKKYGKADSLSPEGVYWVNNSMMLALEKPLVIKYIDTVTRDSILESGKEIERAVVRLKEEFLELF